MRRFHPDVNDTKMERAADIQRLREKRNKKQKLAGPNSADEDSKARALDDAQWEYWRDKPFEMDDDELLQAVTESRVLAMDVVRMIKDYSTVLGPKVGTCVCALCNDFCTESEGMFWSDARERLSVHYKVGCTGDEWNALSTLEKRFRHIVNVSEGTEDDPERYFISERGLQNEVDGKWTWWTDDNACHRDISTARLFVCKACDKPKTGHKRWLINSDPGRIPEYLKKIPLNMSEQIVMNKYIIFNNTVMLDVVKENHLSGHVISIPISQHDKHSREAQLPRLEYSDHMKAPWWANTRKWLTDIA